MYEEIKEQIYKMSMNSAGFGAEELKGYMACLSELDSFLIRAERKSKELK